MMLATIRIAPTMTRYAPVSARALVFLSMAASSRPLPPLERAECHHQAAHGDREEVDDLTGDDLPAREGREAGVEADERDHIAERPRPHDVVGVAQEAQEHEQRPRDEERYHL